MKSLIGILIVSIFFVGCGKLKDPNVVKNEFSLDGVKLLAEDISDSRHSETFMKDQYKLTSNRRLLLRLEAMKDHVSRVTTLNDSKVHLQVRVLGDVSHGTRLKLCSVTRDWMMLATWSYAHPFGTGGKWERGGGDYDESSCVMARPPGKEAAKAVGTVNFDITQWFIDYPKGRQMNFGLVLIADGEVTIAGEKSASYSPRILYHSIAPEPTDWR